MLAGLLWILFAVHVAIIALWGLGALWVRGLRADEGMRLDPLPEAQPDPSAPSLHVFIAAHNEQNRVEACLDRLGQQNYGPLRITVVNDRSDDRTGDGVRAVMARDPRVDLVDVRHLPDGWIGKTHALAVAASNVGSDYLLFMDCDCRLQPGVIAAVMRKAAREGLDFVSLWPRLELLSPAERILTPATSWVLGLWAFLGVRPGMSNSEVKLGNGQFMLLSRGAYERIGGHEAVKGELAEDMAMASKVAALGLRRWAGRGQGLYVTSRDNSFITTFNSLTRVLIGSLVQPWRILLSAQFLLSGVVMPAWLLPLSLWIAASRGMPVGWMLVGGCAVHIAAMFYVVRRLFQLTLEDSPSVFSFLLGSVLTVGLLVWAWLVTTGRSTIRWGKTGYRISGSRVLHVMPEPGQSAA